jgi:inner membrane protein
MVSTPAPFNSLLWRIVVMTDEGYLEGFRSMLDGDAPIRFVPHLSDTRLLDGLDDAWAVRRLRWFTRGFYRVHEADGGVVISDLRMGLEPHYVFSFRVAGLAGEGPEATVPVRLPVFRDYDRLRWVWRRIGDPDAV